MSAVFTLKSVVLEKEIIRLTADKASKKLQKDIETFDKTATKNGTFWNQMIYMIDDLMVQLNLPITEYMDSGR